MTEMRHQGEAICCDCDMPLDWTPEQLMPGSYYVCRACEQKGIDDGTLIRPEEFFGEWDLYDESGERVEVRG